MTWIPADRADARLDGGSFAAEGGESPGEAVSGVQIGREMSEPRTESGSECGTKDRFEPIYLVLPPIPRKYIE